MALPSTTVWEIRTTGSMNNGGGFKPGASGTDYSQQASPQYALTGATSAGAGAVILHASAAADMVGNIINVVSGTNFTAGWYEVQSVSLGVSITVDRNCTTGVGAAGVVNVGGCLIWGGSSAVWASVIVAGNKVWTKSGSYTSVAGTNITSGTALLPIVLEGYNSTRGDLPTGSTRPILTVTATFTSGSFNTVKNMIFTGTAAQVIITGANNHWQYCKAVNTSVTASRAAFYSQSQDTLFACEGVSYRGRAFETQGVSTSYFGCYAHDSDIGIFNNNAGSALIYIQDCIIESCVTKAIGCGTGPGSSHYISGCTLYGSENKTGIGIDIPTGLKEIKVMNCNIYGFVTGVTHADSANYGFDDFNNYSNNTADNTNWTKGSNDQALAPAFTNVGQYTGTAATTSGSVLTDGAAAFTNVVNNQDFVYIKSGTGVTVGQYLITSHTATTLTLDIAPGTSAVADKVYQVTTGRNFALGTALQGLGFPAAHPGGLTTSYEDIGAVQRRIDVPAIADVKTGVVYDNLLKTGTLVSATSTDPGIANVRSGTNYTISDVAKTGTLVVPSLANTKTGVAGDGGNGTYDGSDRWTDPGVANVRNATAYKANSTSNNRTGTVVLPIVGDVRLGVAFDTASTGTLDALTKTYFDSIIGTPVSTISGDIAKVVPQVTGNIIAFT